MPDAIERRGLDLLDKGRRTIESARVIVQEQGPVEVAEKTARAALRLLRSATNWLEASEHFERAHRELDAAGRFTRQTFGCSLTLESGTYYQDCPVALAHTRVGFSIGGIVRKASCSICHQDPEDCEHITGRVYEGEACVRVLEDIELREVSLVGKPANPDARIERMSIDTAELEESLGPEFQPGTPVACDRCLYSCDGVRWPFGS